MKPKTPTPPDKDELTQKIYEAMQIPYLSERHDAINRLIAEASIRELQDTMPHTDGMRHYNTVVKRINELEQSLKEPHNA